LLSYEFSYDNKPHALKPDLEYNNYQKPVENNWYVSCNMSVNNITPHSSDIWQADYSIIVEKASPALRNYFDTVVSPLMYEATIKNHFIALPGYKYSDGLRCCINQLSRFSHSDKKVIKQLIKRLEVYCAKVETFLFRGKNHEFCDTLSPVDQAKLVRLYANFLKEFYTATNAYDRFKEQMPDNPFMQSVMPSINWNFYNKRDIKKDFKQMEKRYAVSVDGKLGVMYKALHTGDPEKAHQIGKEKVKITLGKKEVITSVFQRYPTLYSKVRQACFEHKARVEQLRIAQKKVLEQQAAMMKIHYEEQSVELLFYKHPDLLANRYAAVMMQCRDPQFFEKLHKILREYIPCIELEHLTSDEKGIVIEGGHLHHHITDEAITVIDTVMSSDLDEKINDTVIDFVNASITLVKNDDVLMASRALDACWALLDYAKDTAYCTGSAVVTHTPRILLGACEGVYDSMSNVVKIAHDPGNALVEAVVDTVQALPTLGYYLGKVAYASGVLEAAHDALDYDPQHYQEVLSQYAIDPVVLEKMYEHVKENVSSRDVARVGVRSVIDMMLLHHASKAVSVIAKEFWVELISCMRKAEQMSEAALVVETVSAIEVVPAQCAEELVSLMENANKVGGGAKVTKVAESAKNLSGKTKQSTETVKQLARRYGKQKSAYQKILKSKQDMRPINRLKGKDLNCIADCSVSGNKPLFKRVFLDNYKHYLEPELRVTSTGKIKPSGWHHDPGRRIEHRKRINGYKIEITNYEKHKSGIYRFDWGVEGMQKKPSTFFPSDWSREKVQQEIIEAYKYTKKYKISPKWQPDTNNFSLVGLTNDNIKITMIINPQGKVISAYPKW
jgi:hypothetical protein